MFERRVHALVLGLVMLAAAAVLCVLVAVDPDDPVVQSIDDRWMQWMVDIRSTPLTRLAKWMSFLGGPIITFPLRVIVSVVLAWRRRWFALGVFLGVTLASELCIGPIKALVDRPRPVGVSSRPARPPSRRVTRSQAR